MAEKQGDNAEQDTKSILQQCAQNLLNAVQILNNSADRNSPVPYVSNNGISPVPSVPNNVSNTVHCVSNNASFTPRSAQPRVSIQEEHQRLVGYRPPTPRSSIKPQSGNKKKRIVSGRNGQPIAITIKDTWTHGFVCLSKTCDNQTPSCKEKVELTMAGLGEKKVLFDKNGKWSHINKTLLEAFPKLKDGGGYEILRTADGRKQLIVVPCPPGGYTITYLKGVLNQAKAYVRPIQKSLSLSVELGPCEVNYVCNINKFAGNMCLHGLRRPGALCELI